MWNNLSLSNPINDICEYGKKDAAIIESLPDLVSMLTSSAEILTEDHAIWEEIKIFRNLQAKYKRILHCDKCLQYLQRVGTCIRKMVLLNISTIYLDLADRIIIELQKKDATSYFLPSRQQLEFVLIRTQAAAKLICESLHYSREAFCFLIQRLKVGHLIINLMMATSVTARLNIVFKSLLLQMYTTYKKIYAWMGKLKKGGWEWPKPLDLPEDLEAWINIEDSEYMKPRHLPKDELDFLTTIFDKNSIASTENQQTENGCEPVDEDECMVVDTVNEDNGVLVKRSELEITETVPSESSEKTSESVDSSSSDEQVEVRVKNKNLSKSQKLLLKRIKSSEDIKELKIIWENLDFSAPDLLPQALTPEKIRFIDKMFLRNKRKIAVLKKSKLLKSEMKNEMNIIIKIAQLKFAKTLGLLPTIEKKKKLEMTAEVKPVKSFKRLKELYEMIYQRLQADQKYKNCAKVKKIFKRRKADLKLLIESGEKEEAKLLIFNTSKYFISNYL